MDHVTIDQARAATSAAREMFTRLGPITGDRDHANRQRLRNHGTPARADPQWNGHPAVNGVSVCVHVTGVIRPLLSFPSIDCRVRQNPARSPVPHPARDLAHARTRTRRLTDGGGGTIMRGVLEI